jgi:hypothetical protein
MNKQLHASWMALRWAFFLGPFLAGIDKFFHFLVDWDQYLAPQAQRILGGLSHPFMLLVGVIEMVVGIMVITKWPRLGAYIASLWLALIAINILMTGRYFDIALRDVGLCLSAFGLAKLTEAMAAGRERGVTREPIAA